MTDLRLPATKQGKPHTHNGVPGNFHKGEVSTKASMS